MDNSSYGYFDEILLKAGSVPPGSHHQPRPLNVDSLLFNPFINSTPGATMQISHSFYNTAAASKVKLEDMVLDLPSKSFQASVTQPYERAELGYITNLQSPPLGSDFRGLRSTPMPTFDVRDFIASCNSFNFLGGVEQTGAPVNQLVESSSFMNKLAMPLLNHGDSNVKRLHTRTPSLAPPSRVSNNNLFQALEQHVHQEHEASKLLSPSTSRAFFGPSLADSVPASFKSVLDVPIHQFSPDNLLEKLICDSSNAPNSPSKQDSSALSSEELDIDWSKNEGQSTKRRKMQHKRVVCVAIGEGKQLKGEAPPADLWAWRKYGQKPIKGSPYPRGYYRCSSSKGCSARKQVERSATDPSVLVVTYTSDHNHALPTSKNTIGSAALASMTSLQDDNSEGQSKEGRSSSDVASENLFSSIINTVSSEDEQVVSSLDSLQDKETLCSLQSFPLRARTTGGDSDDEGVFDDLGELPEMSSTFNKGYLEVDLQQMQDGWFS